ncbi:uncharacterized protein F5891DRAFT_986620 [Suillus fuscotomentosus]|uniref:Uncharacterized protein n=1 Tax=Suillus fuscotomentosus TaxID=1912939 RepID=A0AAD4HCK9_9AGAM|nr:uncharacterized protein F5891DRAFT_986620 [Suillus fuscotomentosus]KAG1891750.1 hypothetical protein F5891DRAFT_986620 [Suillus fuscotomentosus]
MSPCFIPAIRLCRRPQQSITGSRPGRKLRSRLDVTYDSHRFSPSSRRQRHFTEPISETRNSSRGSTDKQAEKKPKEPSSETKESQGNNAPLKVFVKDPERCTVRVDKCETIRELGSHHPTVQYACWPRDWNEHSNLGTQEQWYHPPVPPPRPSMFYGREDLVAELTNLAVDDEHITLIGLGGMGKSSPAKAIINKPPAMEKFADGRVFVTYDSLDPSSITFETHDLFCGSPMHRTCWC